MKNNKNIFAEITKKSSKTFYLSGLFFPVDIRNDIFIFYSFVRTADDYIDSKPPQINKYNDYKIKFRNSIKGIKTGNIIIDSFSKLMTKKKIDMVWIDSFFQSLEIDSRTSQYESIEQLNKFIYGVAEIIGLVMARIMMLPEKSYRYARLLGNTMQLVNIIRDIDEDYKLKRVYLPQDELKKYGLPKYIDYKIAIENKSNFFDFINFQTSRIKHNLVISKQGVLYIPKKYRLPIMTSIDLYNWTINKINSNPLIIFKKKVKPPVVIIIFMLIKNLIKQKINKL
jgi:15-cis-phytoene synthase